jgi:hypothetical protein
MMKRYFTKTKNLSNRSSNCIPKSCVLLAAILGGFAADANGQVLPEEKLPLVIDGGAWKAGHVQGTAIDQANGHVYFSFTNLLVKTDLSGKVLGTIGGFSGHLGDLDFNPADGKVYGSLEYKAQKSFYIAIIDVAKVTEMDMSAQNSPLFETIYLPEVVSDYMADMNDDGVFDGNRGDTPDHRFGCSGIDGVTFGPKFGETGGKKYLTVAYGIYSNLGRKDNDHQVILQYDADQWLERYARPLAEATPHSSGPEKADGKYFVYTGNTTYGVQNLAYDDSSKLWLMGVYRGKKPEYPNYSLFAVEASAKPVMKEVQGASVDGLVLPLAPLGAKHEATGIRGWNQVAAYGMSPLGGGLLYIAESGKKDGKQTGKVILNRWQGNGAAAFEKVTR